MSTPSEPIIVFGEPFDYSPNVPTITVIIHPSLTGGDTESVAGRCDVWGGSFDGGRQCAGCDAYRYEFGEAAPTDLVTVGVAATMAEMPQETLPATGVELLAVAAAAAAVCVFGGMLRMVAAVGRDWRSSP